MKTWLPASPPRGPRKYPSTETLSSKQCKPYVLLISISMHTHKHTHTHTHQHYVFQCRTPTVWENDSRQRRICKCAYTPVHTLPIHIHTPCTVYCTLHLYTWEISLCMDCSMYMLSANCGTGDNPWIPPCKPWTHALRRRSMDCPRPNMIN